MKYKCLTLLTVSFTTCLKKINKGVKLTIVSLKVLFFSDTLESEEIIYHNEFVEDNDIQQTDKTGKKSVQFIFFCHN